MCAKPQITERPDIRLLDPTLINQIAAGEVIVRPASVVKELVENSLDAEASHISIRIANDGRDISVTDDGLGIPESQIETALQRHATSKIAAFDDIMELETRGFRGEALASIASVARVCLTSRTPDQPGGVRMIVRAGEVESRQPTGTPVGTRVEVTDLFENVPARRKFLRSPQAEFNAILRIVSQQAMSQPEVGLTLERATDAGVRRVLDLPAEQTLRDRMTQVMGTDIADHLVELDLSDGDHMITGFIARPLMTRSDTRGIHLFVGGRPVANRRLLFALKQALSGQLMSGRHPIAAVFIECPAQAVDVNVHPTKEEVRFDDEDRVAGMVYRAVQGALGATDLRPRIALPGGGSAPFSLPPGQSRSSSPMPLQWSTPQPAPQPAAPGRQTSAPIPPAPPLSEQFPNQQFHQSTDQPLLDPLIEQGATIVPLGQIGDSYIVASCGDDMLVIDQHAAHERLMYHRVQERFRQQRQAVQPLMVPISFDLPATALSHIDDMQPIFAQIGVELEPFGGQTVIIRSLPPDFERIDIAGVVRDVASDLEQGREAPTPEAVRDRILTRMACHAAIKANRRMSHEEMRRLIEEIVRARLPHTCPHGRPTMALLTLEQLDKQFKRT